LATAKDRARKKRRDVLLTGGVGKRGKKEERKIRISRD